MRYLDDLANVDRARPPARTRDHAGLYQVQALEELADLRAAARPHGDGAPLVPGLLHPGPMAGEPTPQLDDLGQIFGAEIRRIRVPGARDVCRRKLNGLYMGKIRLTAVCVRELFAVRPM